MGKFSKAIGGTCNKKVGYYRRGVTKATLQLDSAILEELLCGVLGEIVRPWVVGSFQKPLPFTLGDRVEGNYKGRGKWYPAEFNEESDRPGFYSITYDDSPTQWIRTKKEHVRRLRSE